MNVVAAFSEGIVPAPASLWSPEARAAGPLGLPLKFPFFCLKNCPAARPCWGQKDSTGDSSRFPPVPAPSKGCVGSATSSGSLPPPCPTHELIFMITTTDTGLEPQAPLSQP